MAQEGMQLNVNHQTAKCKSVAKDKYTHFVFGPTLIMGLLPRPIIHRRLQELTDMGGSTQRTRSVIILKIVAVYISPFTLLTWPLAASRLDKPLLKTSFLHDFRHSWSDSMQVKEAQTTHTHTTHTHTRLLILV